MDHQYTILSLARSLEKLADAVINLCERVEFLEENMHNHADCKVIDLQKVRLDRKPKSIK